MVNLTISEDPGFPGWSGQCVQTGKWTPTLFVNSPSRCMKTCVNRGKRFAWVGRDCLCTNKAPPLDKIVSKSQCSLPCRGWPYDRAQICGGSDGQMNVYRTDGAFLGWSGHCVRNSWSGMWIVGTLHNNSPSRCIEKCKKLGYNFAGVGLGCTCNNQAPPLDAIVRRSKCSRPCSGSDFESCGGYAGTMNVYRTGAGFIENEPTTTLRQLESYENEPETNTKHIASYETVPETTHEPHGSYKPRVTPEPPVSNQQEPEITTEFP